MNKRNTPYPKEVTAIETIRQNNPEVGPYVLARQIESGNYGYEARGWGSRTYYSILSVIRRFDARQSVTA